ncbi:class I SAM-dependent methyltransferase [Roseibaca sp. V10]|uniref:Class I SAM-dependent methyltransferase n=1 Tax=Roseinatronobacter domitianus TaxID=2940293 RepID=A0ABT0M496_9RHOB|nr:class I SAM-dependent methyltransferase [Roseibaca domitiana]MCL1629215.1 class I SAM-dependent methyltransferase [Roseibaca domitiana]
MSVLQPSRSTIFNRYPHLFLSAQAWSRQRRPDAKASLRILSFGCSDGSEMASLSCYFPDAIIHGCDIFREGFEANPTGGRAGLFFDSTEDEIKRHGPYDIIFANSVLCAYPLKAPINQSLSFETFNKWVSVLSGALEPSGLLVVYNSSYFFQDAEVFGQFKPIRTPMTYSSGWVPKWSRKETLAIDLGSESQPIFVSDRVDSGRQIDCLFEKSGAGNPVYLPYGVEVSDPYEVLETTKVSRANAILTRETIRTEDERFFHKSSWAIKTCDGGILDLNPWFIPASKEGQKYPFPAIFDTLPPKPKPASEKREKSRAHRQSFRVRLLDKLRAT